MNTQTEISESQKQVLASIAVGDIVTYRAYGCKGFGQKHQVTQVSRDTIYDTTIYSVPVKDTRTKGIAGRTVDTRGIPQVRNFLPYNAENTVYEVKIVKTSIEEGN